MYGTRSDATYLECMSVSVKNDFDAIFFTESPGNLSCFSCKLFFSKDTFHVSSRNYELRIKFVHLSKLNVKIISFPVNFAKFLRAPFLTEHLRWLLLNNL